MHNRKWGSNSLFLLLVDWLIILLFVFIGQLDHQTAGVAGLPSLLTTTLSIGVVWSAAAFMLGAFRLDAGDTLSTWLGRVLTAWLVAAPLGLLLRALLRGQAAIPTAFILVMMGIGGLFMLGWRAVYFWLHARREQAATA